MKYVLKSLVLIWVASFSTASFANDLFAPVSVIEKMYLKKSDEASHLKFNPDIDENLSSEKNINTNKKDLPRLKRIYIGVYGGYFYTKDNMQFIDSYKCSGINADFLCLNGTINPINLDYKDEYFLAGAFGINSENPIRLEFSYFKLGKEIEIYGVNKVGINTRNYKSMFDLQGGSINLYFDFVTNRRDPYFLFVPYVMAGIGISEIDLDNINFIGSNNNEFSIYGKNQRNRTTIYGAGFTAGLNNYISLDIGYRYYNFGKIKTDNMMTETVIDSTNPLNPVINEYDIELETELEAHVATIGIKFQI